MQPCQKMPVSHVNLSILVLGVITHSKAYIITRTKVCLVRRAAWRQPFAGNRLNLHFPRILPWARGTILQCRHGNFPEDCRPGLHLWERQPSIREPTEKATPWNSDALGAINTRTCNTSVRSSEPFALPESQIFMRKRTQ